MRATHKNELAHHIRSVAEELGAVERKFQADRFSEQGVVQELCDQIKALQKTAEDLKKQAMPTILENQEIANREVPKKRNSDQFN